MDLHSVGAEEECGQLNMEMVQQVMAAKWAVDVINNQSLPHELRIGLQIHDTCGHVDLAQQHLYELISSVQQHSRNYSVPGASPRLIGELFLARILIVHFLHNSMCEENLGLPPTICCSDCPL